MDSLTATDLRTVGEFRLLARLGSGGMGQVFLASSLAGRIVAVKVIHRELGQGHGVRPAVPQRGGGRAEGQRLVHRARRGGRGRRQPAVAGDRVCPWAVAGRHRHPVRSAAASGGVAAGRRAGRGAARHPRGRARPPRPQARQRAARAGRAPGHRLRHLPDGHRRDPANRHRAPSSGPSATCPPSRCRRWRPGPRSDTFSLGSVLAFAASGAAPFSGGPGAPSASVMYRIVHGEPDLGAVPADVRGLIEACLAKDPRQRPDLGRVAAHSTATAERLGLSPAAFWPREVAKVIQAQQAALTAQIEALQIAPGTHVEGREAAGRRRASVARRAGTPRARQRPGAPVPGSGRRPASGRAGGRAVAGGTGRPGGPGAGDRDRLERARGSRAGGPAPRGRAAGACSSGPAWGASRSSAARSAGRSARGRRRIRRRRRGPGRPRSQPERALPTGQSLQKYYGAATRRAAAWKFATGNAIEANPGAGGGMVYVGEHRQQRLRGERRDRAAGLVVPVGSGHRRSRGGRRRRLPVHQRGALLRAARRRRGAGLGRGYRRARDLQADLGGRRRQRHPRHRQHVAAGLRRGHGREGRELQHAGAVRDGAERGRRHPLRRSTRSASSTPSTPPPAPRSGTSSCSPATTCPARA